MTSPRFTATFVDDTRSGFIGIWDDNKDGRLFASVETTEQADYALTILNNGGLAVDDDYGAAQGDLESMVTYTNCVKCGDIFMQGTLDASKRCVGCQS